MDGPTGQVREGGDPGGLAEISNALYDCGEGNDNWN